MKFVSDSSNFENKVLIYDEEILNIMSTKDQVFSHFVGNEYQKSFTVQSLCQALYNGYYIKREKRINRRPFYIIDYTNLVEV